MLVKPFSIDIRMSQIILRLKVFAGDVFLKPSIGDLCLKLFYYDIYFNLSSSNSSLKLFPDGH